MSACHSIVEDRAVLLSLVDAQQAEIERVTGERDRLIDRNVSFVKREYESKAERDVLVQRTQALEEALRFYADRKVWRYEMWRGSQSRPVDADQGDRARAALKGEPS